MAESTLLPFLATEDRGSTILAVTWTETALALVIVGARFYVRSALVRKLGLDDWIILVSLLFALISSALTTAAVSWGLGRHYESLDPMHKLMAIKLDWISQVFAIYCCGLGKISISVLLLRLMRKMLKNKALAWFLYILNAVMLMIDTVGVASIFFQCTPSRKIWEPDVKGSCLDPHVQVGIGFARAAFSAFSDLALAIFPLTFIYKLQLKMPVKIGLGFAMSLGLFACSAAIVKTVLLQEQTAREDYTYNTVDLTICLVTEMYVVIIAACVPTLRPLLPIFHKLLPCRKTKPKKRSVHLSTLPHGFQGYRTLGRSDGHGLHTSPAKGPNRDSHANAKRIEDARQQSDADDDKVNAPDPGLNRILKSTRMEVSYSDRQPADEASQRGSTHFSVNGRDMSEW